MRLSEKMDCGDILLTQEIEISPDDDAISLQEKLANLGAEALICVLDNIEEGNFEFKKQDESKATLAPKLKKAEGLINWQQSAETIFNQVRGLLPWPCAFTHYQGKNLKVLKVKVCQDNISNIPNIPGEEKYSAADIVAIEKGKGIIIKTGENNLLIELLQPEGKKVMPAYDFVLGHKVQVGDKFT